MIKLFFDIETIPSAEEEKEMHLAILKKRKINEDRSDGWVHENTSFEGTFGRICCIAVIKESGEGMIVQKEVFKGTEKEILTKFWESAKDVNRFIGHNIWAFDLPFIYKRSIINGIRPRQDISFARYRNTPIYDTMMEWELWNMQKSQKLDTLAKVFGFPTSKDEMDGSMVYTYYQQGRIDEICTYCMKDVVLTRQVYKKMTFESEEYLPQGKKEEGDEF